MFINPLHFIYTSNLHLSNPCRCGEGLVEFCRETGGRRRKWLSGAGKWHLMSASD